MSEAIIETRQDRDFGTLDLVETRFRGGITGEEMREHSFRRWNGKECTGSGEAFELHIMDNGDTGIVDGQTRARYRRLISEFGMIKSKVGLQLLETAQSWAEDGGLSLDLTAESLADSLTLSDLTLHTDGEFECIFNDHADIFMGHVVLARIDADMHVHNIGLGG